MSDQGIPIADALAIVRQCSSVGRSSDVLHVEPCGCRVVRDAVGCGLHIEWCKAHRAVTTMPPPLDNDRDP